MVAKLSRAGLGRVRVWGLRADAVKARPKSGQASERDENGFRVQGLGFMELVLCTTLRKKPSILDGGFMLVALYLLLRINLSIALYSRVIDQFWFIMGQRI